MTKKAVPFNIHVYHSFCSRNLLLGSTSTNDNEIVAFPGLVELFAADFISPQMKSNEISKHITEIMGSIDDVGDYGRRAFDPDL